MGKILCNNSGNEKLLLCDLKSFVDFNDEDHGLFHDWPDFIDNKDVEHFQEEFGVNFDIGGHFFEEFEDFDEEGVSEVEAFLVELVLGDFHVFHAFVDDFFVHDVGDDFIDEGGELFGDGFVVDDWEFVDFIEREGPVSSILDRRNVFDNR